MTTFAENLAGLPGIEHLQCIELSVQEVLQERIPNQPGKQGSLRVYYALHQRFGELHAEAARVGLALFAEHTEDARQHPGKHPNIDRLLAVIEQDLCMQIRPIVNAGEST
ncbi:MAG: DUF2322 family protein [Chromatiales bacterium]|nr:DUF2322 family protein [Gammaproteobacteria bacterium]MBW6477352.1 DUF2322 family protein [Chromatiales bacterium]